MALHIEIRMLDESSADLLLVTLGSSQVVLDTGDVDGLIDRLSKLRSGMRPVTPQKLAIPHQYVIEMDPRWQIVKNPLFDGLLMLLRHSGLGWSCFAMPNHSIGKILEAMTTYAKPAHLYQRKYLMKN